MLQRQETKQRKGIKIERQECKRERPLASPFLFPLHHTKTEIKGGDEELGQGIDVADPKNQNPKRPTGAWPKI